MKKILFTLILIISSMCVNAQSSNTIYVGWVNLSFFDTEGTSDNGIKVGFQHNEFVGNKNDIYLSTSFDLNYLSSSELGINENVLDMSLNVNAKIRLAIDDNVSFNPFIGPSLKLNLIGYVSDNYDNKIDYFDDLDANRIDFGMNVGSELEIKNFIITYKFAPYFTNYFDLVDSKAYYNSVTVGFKF